MIFPNARSASTSSRSTLKAWSPSVFSGMRRLHERSENSVIITEYAYENWSRHGDPVELLRNIAGKRSVFWIGLDGSISRAGANSRKEINRVSYVLMIREDDPRFEAISYRLR